MKKLVWAIAAIFCVQVVFQLVMMAERSDADYALLQTPLHQPVDPYTSPVVSDSDLIVPDDLSIDDSDAQASFASLRYRPPAGADTGFRGYGLERPSRFRHRRHQGLKNPEPFKPVIITYKRYDAPTEAVTFRVETKAQAAPPIVQPTEDRRPLKEDKRPLIAKVVTKPYDWLKTVASKLH